MPLSPERYAFLDNDVPRIVAAFLAESGYVLSDSAIRWIREFADNREPELALETIAFELDDALALASPSRLGSP